MVDVEYGDEVDEVRLVPLPDGRVVLVTGDGVSFFRAVTYFRRHVPQHPPAQQLRTPRHP